MKPLLLSLLLLFPLISSAQKYDTVRICTYNLLNFSDTKSSRERVDELRLILNEIQPDILMVQEFASEEGKILFQLEVLSTLDKIYGSIAGELSDEQSNHSWMYYNIEKFKFTIIPAHSSTLTLSSEPQNHNGLLLTHITSEKNLHIVSVHMKAGNSEEDKFLRRRSAERLYEYAITNVTRQVIFGGTFNVYSSSEEAYQELRYPLIDPIDRPGDWHNNPDFADVHTQSTRVREFGDGVQGGLDDRFDQILMSDRLRSSYVEGSYTTFGNDGKHFNDSINAMPNEAVSAELAQALHDASDHLPVYLDLYFFNKTVSVEDESEWVEGLLNLW